MYTDPISEMTTKIVNGQRAKKPVIVTEYSMVKVNMLSILKQKGFIQDYVVEFENQSPQLKCIKVILKYVNNNDPVIHEIKRVSKPSRRVYIPYHKIKPVMNGFAVSIYSTNKGLLTDKQAIREKTGGEFMVYVW